MNSFGHYVNVGFIAVRSVDIFHHDVTDREGSFLPRESAETQRITQTRGWNVAESLGNPILRQGLGDSNVWAVLNPGDDGLSLVDELDSQDIISRLVCIG